MEEKRLIRILDGIKGLRAGMLGDLCIDIYWRADMRRSELSRETPHYPLPVTQEWFSPGAAGNLAANMLALGPKETHIFGVLGKDWRAKLVEDELNARKAELRHVISDDERVTNGYCKPLRAGISDVVYEDPRIDFENYSPLSVKTEDKLLKSLEFAGELDVLCVGDQFMYGCVTPRVRERVMELARQGLAVFVDSRLHLGDFHGVALKPNEREVYTALGREVEQDVSLEEYKKLAKELALRNNSRVVMTLGSIGSLFADSVEGGGSLFVPAAPAEPPVDIVGAGDTYLAGLALSHKAGADWAEAMKFASLCANVTVRKIGTTGVAVPEEIIEANKAAQSKRA